MMVPGHPRDQNFVFGSSICGRIGSNVRKMLVSPTDLLPAPRE